MNVRRKHSSGGLTEFECRYYFKQLISALKYMHNEHRVIHRDIKLGNCFLDS